MATANKLCSALRRRFSPRAFADRPLKSGTVEILLEAGRWAPSSFNEQPWRFIAATRDPSSPEGGEHFARLAACLMAGNAWAKAAPLLVITAAKKTFTHNGEANAYAWHDLGLATAQLLAQATHLGLVSHPMGGFDKQQAIETLAIPSDFEPVAALAIGYRGDWRALEPALQERELAPRQRKPFDELVHLGKWDSRLETGQQEAEAVLDFWFGKVNASGMADADHRASWWKKDPAFDTEIRNRFEALMHAVRDGQRQSWLANARGRLAAVILLDQFSRNIYRDQASMYAADALALRLAREAVEAGLDRELAGDLRTFLYMPFMHSEALEDQQRCVALFSAFRDEAPEPQVKGLEQSIDYAQRHLDIVARFGRFPHRNAILGRESTAEETAFLQEPGSAF